MLQVSVENLGNSFKNALDTGDWGSFVGAILTSAPMLISSLTQISGGWTKISSLMDMQIGKSAKVVAAKMTEATSSTANKFCVISAVAVPGTKVTLYNYESSRGQYVKMYSDGRALEAVVGAAGLYARTVSLKNGANTILVVASNGNSVETVKLDITVVKSEASGNIINIWQTLSN